MTKNCTLVEVKQAVDTAFVPDIVLGVTEDGNIYSRSPRTKEGWKWMRITRGIFNVDQARLHAAQNGVSAIIETH